MNSTEYDLKQRLKESEVRVDDLRTYVKKMESELVACRRESDSRLEKAQSLNDSLESRDWVGGFSICAIVGGIFLGSISLFGESGSTIGSPSGLLVFGLSCLLAGIALGNFVIRDYVPLYTWNNYGLCRLQYDCKDSSWFRRLSSGGEATDWREVQQ